MEKRQRRKFTKEYKAEVVDLIRKSGKSVGAVSSELGLTETAVRHWFSEPKSTRAEGRYSKTEMLQRVFEVDPGAA